MRDFNEYILEEVVRKITPDKKRAGSLDDNAIMNEIRQKWNKIKSIHFLSLTLPKLKKLTENVK